MAEPSRSPAAATAGSVASAVPAMEGEPPPPGEPPADAVVVPLASSAAAPRGCRSALPFERPRPPSDADAPQPAALATSPRVVAACEALATKSRARASAQLTLLSDEARDLAFAPLVRCYAARDGAWTFEVTSSWSTSAAHRGVAGDEHAARVTLRARPVFVDAAGVTTPSARAISVLTGNARFVVESRVDDPRTFDWDGDGRPELFFAERYSQEENQADAERSDRFWIFTARGGAVTEYLPAAKRAVRIADEDGDGLPDVVLESPWITAGPCGISDVYFSGPRSLLHARRDGTFSSDDDVTRGFIADQCRVRPERLLLEDERPSRLPPFVIGCARWWGASGADVTGRLLAELAARRGGDEADGCFPRKELLRASRVEPPSSFRLRCE